MKNIYLLFVLLMSEMVYGAIPPKTLSSTSLHLRDVNQQWDFFEMQDENEIIQFNSDIDRIQYHLFSVIEVLSKGRTNHLTLSQQSNRTQLLKILNQYAHIKNFPHNTNHSERRPYFIDHRGVHCAVGFLMLQSGYGELAKRIAAKDNYVYVKEIEVDGVEEWATWSGFSIQELALIQPGYLIQNYFDPFPVGPNGVGTPNGPIKSATANFSEDHFFLVGDFTQLGETPCERFAMYQKDVGFTCVLDQINGDVRQMTFLPYGNDRMYFVGRFEHEGTIYPIARYLFGNISYIGIEGYPNAEGTAVSLHNQNVYFGIKTETGQHLLYTFNKWEMSDKAIVAEFDGPIYALSYDYSGTQLHIGGHFNTITSDDQTIFSKNYVIYNSDYSFPSVPYTDPFWTPTHYPLADTVRCIHPAEIRMHEQWEEYDRGVYIGGYAYQDGSPKTPLGRVEDGIFEPLIDFSMDNWFSNRRPFEEVRTIYAHKGMQRIYFGGDLSEHTNPALIMYYGRNLYSYGLNDGLIKAEGTFNQPVNAIFNMTDNEIDVLGEFVGIWSDPDNGVNYVATKTSELKVEQITNSNDYLVFPNPTNELVKLTGNLEYIQFIEIVNLSGQVVAKQNGDFESIYVDHLNDGLYTIHINTENGILARKFIVRK